jgi:transposase-like protein
MNSIKSSDGRREQAIALRRAGKSRREIKEILGVGSNTTLNGLLAGEPPPEWTRRPNAKDDLHAQARRMREQGYDYNRIAAELGASKGTVSARVHDMPWPERLSYEECRKRAAEGVRRYWEAERAEREAKREATRAAAAVEIGALTHRDLLIAGAVAYWCEGAKNKPYLRHDRVVFINSEPGLIMFFLRFLEAAGIDRGRLIYRVQIHESADVAAAEQFWLTLTGAAPDQFRRTTLKRHNPKTVRKNVGSDYRGCLRVDVRQSSGLYRQIEGWVRAALGVAETDVTTP